MHADWGLRGGKGVPACLTYSQEGPQGKKGWEPLTERAQPDEEVGLINHLLHLPNANVKKVTTHIYLSTLGIPGSLMSTAVITIIFFSRNRESSQSCWEKCTEIQAIPRRKHSRGCKRLMTGTKLEPSSRTLILDIQPELQWRGLNHINVLVGPVKVQSQIQMRTGGKNGKIM